MRIILPGSPALCRILLIAVAAAFAAPPALASDDPAGLAEATPTRVLSVVSGGYWEEKADVPAAEERSDDNGSAEESETTVQQDLRGYYRSVAIRSEDNTSRLFLQRIQLTDEGPMLLDSQEITTLTELRAYITDMRPENSTGIAKRQGFVTFVYLKKDPQAQEPDTWELYVDEFGDTAFTPASN